MKKGVREKVFKSIPLTLRVLKSGWRGGLCLKIYDNCVVSEMALNVHHVNSLACPLPVACLRRVIKQKLSFSLPPRHDDDDEYADDGDECFPNKLTKFIGTNSPPFSSSSVVMQITASQEDIFIILEIFLRFACLSLSWFRFLSRCVCLNLLFIDCLHSLVFYTLLMFAFVVKFYCC